MRDGRAEEHLNFSQNLNCLPDNFNRSDLYLSNDADF